MSVHKAESDLADLKARERALEAELVALRAEIERIQTFLDYSERYGLRNIPPQREEDKAGEVEIPTESDASDRAAFPMDDEAFILACRGKSIPDAAIALIELAGHPLSEEQLVYGLRRGGVTLVSDTPELNLRFALLKKRKESNAVKLVDNKCWAIDEASYKPHPENQSDPSQDSKQSERTEKARKGLLAARQRGVKNGRRSTITPQSKELAIRLIAEGVSKAEIAKQIGITTVSFYRWIRAGRLDEENDAI